MKIDKTYSLLDALATLFRYICPSKARNTRNFCGKPEYFPAHNIPSHLQHLVYRINDSKAGITLLDRLTIPDGCSFDIYFENFNNKRRKYRKEFIFATVDKFMQHVERSLQVTCTRCRRSPLQRKQQYILDVQNRLLSLAFI